MSSVIKWAVTGAVAAVPAGALAYVGGPLGHAGLAVWAVLVAVGLLARQDRQFAGLRTSVHRSARSIERVREHNDQLRLSLKEIKAENAALKQQVAKARTALEDKIGLAVQRLHEKFRAELQSFAQAQAAAKRDAEVETGLEALNRYTALASQAVKVNGSDEDSAAGSAAV